MRTNWWRYRSGIQSFGSIVSPRAIRASNSALRAVSSGAVVLASMSGIYCACEGWTINPGEYLLPMSAKDPRQEGHVTVDVRDAVAVVRFGHPKSNSLPSALLRKMAGEIGKVATNSGVKVIVLRSEGTGAFCGGASFDEMKSVTDAPSGREFFGGFAHVMLALVRAPQFVLVR